MFEKEAKDYAIENYETCLYDDLPYANDSRAREQSFKDGAEFGFKKGVKAKINTTTISDCPIKDEWHYVKDGDLPKDEDYKWCISSNGIFYVAKYEELFLSWTNQEHKEVCCPYAWKEIVPPRRIK